MRTVLLGTVRSRAIIAVIALYGLCLQAFLGTLPLPPQPAGVICAHETSDAPTDPVQACRHSCCVLVHAAQLGPAPAAAFAWVAWPMRAAAPPIRPAVTLADARAPPDQSVSSRGPPAA